MVALILDPDLEREIIAQRQAWGIDHHDEVWEGVYFIASPKDNHHQHLLALLASVFIDVLGFRKLGKVLIGANVSDRRSHWEQNYRVPDLLVFLPGNAAEDRDTHWLGGPDLAVEIVSPGDRTYEKVPFYATVNTREVLVIDRHPWTLVLFRLQEGMMVEVARAAEGNEVSISSEVLPLTFGLRSAELGPKIVVRKHDGSAEWIIDGR